MCIRPRRWYIFWNDGMSMVFHMSTIGINGFSNGFSIRDNGYSMFFYRWTIGINGLSNGFSIRDDVFSMVFQRWTIGIDGFSNGFSIIDDGDSMVFYRWTIGIDGFLPLNHWYQWFFQWFLTVETLVSMVWRKRAMVINGSQKSASSQ